MSRVRRIYHQVPHTFRPLFILVDASQPKQALAPLAARVGVGFLLGGTVSILAQCMNRFILGRHLFAPDLFFEIIDVPEFLTVIGFAFAFLLLGLSFTVLDEYIRVYKLKSMIVSSTLIRVCILLLIVGIPAMTTQFANNFVIPELFGTSWLWDDGTWVASAFMAMFVPVGIILLWRDGVGKGTRRDEIEI